jgi:hypothetical protein
MNAVKHFSSYQNYTYYTDQKFTSGRTEEITNEHQTVQQDGSTCPTTQSGSNITQSGHT